MAYEWPHGGLDSGQQAALKSQVETACSAAVANSTASSIAMVDANKRLQTSASVGTAGTGVTAVEYGDGRTHQTVLTLGTGCVLQAIAGGAALGVGALLYTFPAGAQIIDASYMSVAITQTQAHINANQPKVGLGTVIASGVVSALSGTATFQDILTGQTAADCNGTATVKTALPTAGIPFITESAGSKAVYFNAAATWSASGDAAALLTGTVVLNWRSMA
jgi:hypothetical protein